MPDLITQAELARRMGVNRKEVTKWKQQDRLVWQGKKIDYEATVKLLAETADPARSSIKKSSNGKMSYVDARTNKILVSLARDQLKYQTEKGELVNVQEVLFELTKAHTVIKNRLRSIKSFVQLDISEIYNDTDIKKRNKVSEVVGKHVDDVLEELSEWKPES